MVKWTLIDQNGSKRSKRSKMSKRSKRSKIFSRFSAYSILIAALGTEDFSVLFVVEKCRSEGFLDEFRHLSRVNFESPWNPVIVRQNVESIVVVGGYKSHEKYIMWKVFLFSLL